MAARSPSDAHYLYPHPAPVARRLLWHLLAIGHEKQRGITTQGAFSKPGVGVIIVEAGRGELQLPTGRFKLRPAVALWAVNMQQHRASWPTEGGVMHCKRFRFGGPNLGAWIEEIDLNRRPEFEVPELATTRRIWRDLMRLAQAQPLGWEYEAHEILSGFMSYLLALRRPLLPKQADLPGPINRILDTIGTNPDRAWRVNELASIAGISYPRLRELFRESMGDSLHTILQQKRVDRARMLLAEGRLSVKEIAEKLHFGNEYYFSNFFKKRTGSNPTAFRRHLAIKPSAELT